LAVIQSAMKQRVKVVSTPALAAPELSVIKEAV
jgi:hypothetical protein